MKLGHLLNNQHPSRAFFLVCILFLTSDVTAQQTPDAISQLFDQSCLDCHDSSSKDGGLDIESLTLNLEDPDNFHVWERIFDRVRDGEMPPDDALDKSETTEFVNRLHAVLKNSDADRIETTGRVPARRLTRAQYERNVCDLLAIKIPLSDYLPEESLTNGFDTVSKSQQISNHSMSAYLKAADVALDDAFGRLLKKTTPSKVRLDWEDLRRDEVKYNREPEGRPKQKDVVSWSTRQAFYGRMHATTVDKSGWYRIRVRCNAINAPKNGRVWCSVKSGVCNARASTLYWIDSFEATEQTNEQVFEAWIREGHQLQIRPRDKGLRRAPVPTVRSPAGNVGPLNVPGLAIKWIEMEYIEPDRGAIRQSLIGDLKLQPIKTDGSNDNKSPIFDFEIVSNSPEQDLKKLIHSFAERAFRRPVSSDELLPYFEFANSRLKASASMHDALRTAYRTILCSARFLYFEESPGALDDHALANRLSHFLWGLGPDEELRRLATNGSLSEPEVLRQQTNRLLNDDRSITFIEEFTNQWLMLHELDSTTPDGKLYPEYDDILHHSLPQESYVFVRELIDRDLSVTNVIDSNFTFLNSRLARHYGIEWGGELGMQRASLDPDDNRGGIITQASVMKVTANGTTTSPIVRGVWMLERIMGLHVPPPPANVPAVEPDIRGATTIRDQLDKHRNLESCAACHVKIDPPGFALESFDVVGAWRENYRIVKGEKRGRWKEGPEVDPSHELSSGESFKNIAELKQLLVKHPKKLARNLASQFVTYATGAAPTFADRETLDSIADATEEKNYGVRSLLHEVIQSDLFCKK